VVDKGCFLAYFDPELWGLGAWLRLRAISRLVVLGHASPLRTAVEAEAKKEVLMAELTCPSCDGARTRATYICEPCNNPAGTGKTVWTVTPTPGDPTTGVPARQQCPGCTTERSPALLTCLDCGKSWVPPKDDAEGPTPRGTGIATPMTIEQIQAGAEASQK
jgi:hypothetical protein